MPQWPIEYDGQTCSDRSVSSATYEASAMHNLHLTCWPPSVVF